MSTFTESLQHLCNFQPALTTTCGLGRKVGPSVRIGNRVRIGPNAVVWWDVPDDTTVVAPPARTMSMKLPLRDHAEGPTREFPAPPGVRVD